MLECSHGKSDDWVVFHDSPTEARQCCAIWVACRWLRAIRDDNRAGRGEIAYDEYSYKRREGEFKEAASKGLEAILEILAGVQQKTP